MFRLWMEWDYGQEYYIFESKEKGIKWANAAINFADFDGEFGEFQDVLDAGLAGFDTVTII